MKRLALALGLLTLTAAPAQAGIGIQQKSFDGCAFPEFDQATGLWKCESAGGGTTLAPGKCGAQKYCGFTYAGLSYEVIFMYMAADRPQGMMYEIQPGTTKDCVAVSGQIDCKVACERKMP